MGKTIILLNYQWNKKEIAATKCENRDKPQMHCNGKCYLSKQLKKAEEKETTLPNFNSVKEFSPFVPTELNNITFFSFKSGDKAEQNYCIESLVDACPGAIFQPPEYIA